MNRIDGNQPNPLQSQLKKSESSKGTVLSKVAGNPSSSDGSETAAADTVDISLTGRQLNELEKSLDSQAFNAQKVAMIKQAIDDGTYKPNSASIAQHMIDMDNNFS